MAHDLNLTLIADSQADGQWQSSNDGLTQLGNALADQYPVDFSAGNITLNSTQYRSSYTFKPSAALAAARTLILPAVKRPFVFHNSDATYAVTLKKTNGNSPETATTIPIAAGAIFHGYTDGTATGLFGAVIAAATGGGGDANAGSYYDFGAWFEACPAAGTVIGRVRIGRNITVPAGMAGSSGGVATNPGATFDIDVRDDGSSIGTISVSTSGTVTFSTAGGTSKAIAAGSEIRFVAPANSPAEATVVGGNFIILATVD
ncbi:hypothetical protein EOD10_19440 [Mesorhizobium sp. M7A.T.Ca.TU.009.01.3.2]|nr:hypothetical protein EOD10_19440 [Mesorhizobium sp. M7A.T.Ca.TU.009.01.3.2]RUU95160.1 hypothetical protein EOD00_26500 [Mesorhizobium sp. M7A.T.Ca.TU.009.01.3.1]